MIFVCGDGLKAIKPDKTNTDFIYQDLVERHKRENKKLNNKIQ